MQSLAATCMIVCGSVVATTSAAEDAYIKAEGQRWTLGTATAERVVALENGKLLLKSLKNKATGAELVAGGAASEEFFFRVGDARPPISGATGPWKLVRPSKRNSSKVSCSWI